MNNLNSIGRNTNCFIEIKEGKGQGMYILIWVNDERDAVKGKCKLRNAKEAIEMSLLEYIKNGTPTLELLTASLLTRSHFTQLNAYTSCNQTKTVL